MWRREYWLLPDESRASAEEKKGARDDVEDDLTNASAM
jgi:hypothetical protein